MPERPSCSASWVGAFQLRAAVRTVVCFPVRRGIVSACVMLRQRLESLLLNAVMAFVPYENVNSLNMGPRPQGALLSHQSSRLRPWPLHASGCLTHVHRSSTMGPPAAPLPTSLPLLTLQSLPITGQSCVGSTRPPRLMRRLSASESCPLPFAAHLSAGLQEPADPSPRRLSGHR